MDKYETWIAEYRARHESWIRCAGSTRGLCQEASTEMAKTFPELRQVRGFVNFRTNLGTEEAPDCWPASAAHWWCVAPDGTIVDPTRDQFQDGSSKGGPLKYVAYESETHGPEPTGKCYNCGSYTYGGKQFCDRMCELSAMSDF